MNEFEFLVLAATHWLTFGVLSVGSAALLWLAIRKRIIGGIFDPLVLALVAGYSVNYAVVMFLYLQDRVTTFLFATIFLYGATLILVLRYTSVTGRRPVIATVIAALTPRSAGPATFRAALFLYVALGLFIVSSIGFGIFAETNRFDAARGFGSYIRLLDFLGPFIVAYSTLQIYHARRHRVAKGVVLGLFVLLAAMISGAKISVIFSICTVFFTLALASARVRLRRGTVWLAVLGGIAFSMAALAINLQQNSVEEASGITGGGLLLERFVFRIVASGDTSYLLLPDSVIDKIDTDNVLVRFAAPFIGTGNISNLLGYAVGDYSVGRQALLYHDPGYDVFGGPTSHFDLFAYVYFGPVAGWIFVVVLAAFLGSINRTVRHVRRASALGARNDFRVALVATLWTRAVLLIIEPTVALAYIVDVLVFFALLAAIFQVPSLLRPTGRRQPTAQAPHARS